MRLKRLSDFKMPTKLRGRFIGAGLKRKEDLRHITGRGTFIDDITLPGMLYAAILRSPYAHAKIKAVNVDRALSMPGVVAALTGGEVAELTQPFPQMTLPPASNVRDYCMAVEKVRYVGEPVAAVVAEDRYTAEDAVEQIDVDYEPLPPVLDPIKAMEPGSPLVHEEAGTNLICRINYDYGDVDSAFKKADRVIEVDLHFHRFSSTPLETYGVVASFNQKTGGLTIYCNNQMPMFFFPALRRALNISADRLRIITPDIGGGFGIKILTYPYMVLVSLLSMKTGRPVKWIEDRREHLTASAHGNERLFHVEAAVKRDGRILGLKVKTVDDEGAYARHEPAGTTIWAQVSSGCYRFRHLRQDVYAVFTNKCPVGPNRGYSRMQHQFMLERLIDIVARELNLDPTAVRLMNYIRRKDQPYRTLNGCVYDDGDYPKSLRMAMKLLDHEGWRRKQAKLRGEGRYIGIGYATTLDSGTPNFGQVRMLNPDLPLAGQSEAASVHVTPDAKVIVRLGSVSQGQSHETTVAQVVADVLGVSIDDVTVAPGFDSSSHPYTLHSGTYGSQFAATGLGAAYGAAVKLRDKIVRIAAHLLRADPKTLEVGMDGEIRVKGRGGRSISLRRIARVAYGVNIDLPKGMEPGLYSTYVYKPDFKAPDDRKMGNLTLTYSYQTHGAVVEVDVETGHVKILDYVTVDDCGRIINPRIVEGQVHGAAAHGIAAALYEKLEYDANGQLLTSTFTDYLAPGAMDLPDMKVQHIEIPSPFAPLGAKGVGEGCGTSIPTIVNAVEDALAPFGVRLTDTYISPEQILQLIRGSKRSS